MQGVFLVLDIDGSEKRMGLGRALLGKGMRRVRGVGLFDFKVAWAHVMRGMYCLSYL
jgi:hypothetical protein